MYYAFIENEKINGCGQCKTIGILNIEISKDVFDNIEKYIYSEGAIIPDPDYETKQAQKERNRLDLLSLTKREVFLGLYQAKGITPEQIKAQITDPAGLIEFEYANDYFRGNPLINTVGQALGITSDQLDKFFDETKKGNPDAYKYLSGEVEEENENTTDTTDIPNEVETEADTAEETNTNSAE